MVEAAKEFSRFTPAVPVKAPVVGDRVNYVLKKLGAGVEFHPKVRPAIVTEDWQGLEKHPTGEVRGQDGKPFARDGKPFVPVGTVNLEIHLDGFARKDHLAGHNKYEGHVVYDPSKAPGTWHWPGE